MSINKATVDRMFAPIDPVTGNPFPWQFESSAPKLCERARRDNGLTPRLDCDICGRGPCGRRVRYLPDEARRFRTEQVPNRLYGAKINHEGDAI